MAEKVIVTEFELNHKETTPENINRLINRQLESILGHCETRQEDMHTSIHEIRKSCKRIRAILRLIRDEIGYSSYYRENVFYRDLGRKLSDIRSFNVLIETTRILQTDLSNTIPETEIEPLLEEFQLHRDKLLEMTLLDENLFGNISKQVQKAGKRIPDLVISHNDFRAFKGGLLRIYKQGKKYRDLARTQPSNHNLHDLRKRIKYLWYQMLILQPIFPAQLKAYAETLDKIGENLGNYHDFAELQTFLKDHADIIKDPVHTTLRESCEFKKASILNRTWNAIDTIYRDEPVEIAGRFNQYWTAYKNESGGPNV